MTAELRSDTMAPAWWRRASDDLAAAEELAGNGFSAAWVIAYHARQAVEKFIKAYLVAHGLSSDTPGFRTHEIDDLRDLVGQFDADRDAALISRVPEAEAPSSPWDSE